MEKDIKPFNIKIKLKFSTEITMLIAFVVVCGFFALRTEYFLTWKNMINIGIYSAIIGASATGMTVALISGGFDISVGSIMALVSMVCAAVLQDYNLSSTMAVIIGLFFGLLCGVINGLLTTVTKINALITTLATASIFRGVAYLYNNGLSVIIADTGFKEVGRGYLLGVPLSILIMVVCFLVLGYVMRYTSFGRTVYAVGSNEVASKFSGIKTQQVRFWAFTICGFMAGIGGVLLASQSGAGIPTGANGYEMDIIAACVIGGTSIKGGKGSLIGSFFGILLLGALSNGMTMTSIPTFVQMIVKGVVLLTAVGLDNLRSRKA